MHKKPLREADCVPLYSTTFDDFFNLSGLFTFKTRQDFDLAISIDTTTSNYDLRHFNERVFIDATYNELIKKFMVDVDTKTKIIDNRMIILNKEKEGKAVPRLLKQIETGRKYDYKYIYLEAAGSPQDKEFVGYCVWCKLGFLMTDETDQEDFIKLMKTHGRTETSLNELVTTKTGSAFWTNNGFPWCGYFDLSIGSESCQLLYGYLESRNLLHVLKDYAIEQL